MMQGRNSKGVHPCSIAQTICCIIERYANLFVKGLPPSRPPHRNDNDPELSENSSRSLLYISWSWIVPARHEHIRLNSNTREKKMFSFQSSIRWGRASISRTAPSPVWWFNKPHPSASYCSQSQTHSNNAKFIQFGQWPVPARVYVRDSPEKKKKCVQTWAWVRLKPRYLLNEEGPKTEQKYKYKIGVGAAAAANISISNSHWKWWCHSTGVSIAAAC